MPLITINRSVKAGGAASFSPRSFRVRSVSERVSSVQSAHRYRPAGRTTSPSVCAYRTICVCLPQELTDVSVSTTNEAISATGTISAQNVSLTVNGGDLSFEKISAGSSVTLNAKNGNITGTIVGSWDDYAITCNVKKGETSLPESKTGGSKTLAVDCNNGDVEVEIANA